MNEDHRNALKLIRFDFMKNRFIFLAFILMLASLWLMNSLPGENSLIACLLIVPAIFVLIRSVKNTTADMNSMLISFLIASGFTRKNIWDSRVMSSLLLFPMFAIMASCFDIFSLDIWQKEALVMTLVFSILPAIIFMSSRLFFVKDRSKQWKFIVFAGLSPLFLFIVLMAIVVLFKQFAIISMIIIIAVSLVLTVIAYRYGVKRIETEDA